MAATLELEIIPRKPFREFLLSTTRWACLVCHRRAGKTVACVQKLIKKAAEFEGKDGRFAYIAPTYAQAKDVAWGYLKQFTSAIPGAEIRESDLCVIFPSGARIRLYGSDNYDRLRGLYLDGVVIDEAGDHDPRAWPEVIRPALADRMGWAVFIGTPKGKNDFYRIYEKSVVDDDWYSLMLKASESGLLAEEELQSAKKDLSDNQFAQEFECSFDAAIQGAYYAELLHVAQAQGRISHLAADPLMPITAYWDIGGTGARADATSIWIAQTVKREIRVLDYYEAQGQPLASHINWLRSSGYDGCKCVLPHDGATHDKVYNVSFESALTEAGFRVDVVPNQGAGAARKRIEETRRRFEMFLFADGPTAPGREALASYHEKMDLKRGVALGPNHDWSSHAADAFGLIALTYQEPRSTALPPSPKFSMV